MKIPFAVFFGVVLLDICLLAIIKVGFLPDLSLWLVTAPFWAPILFGATLLSLIKPTERKTK